MEVKVSRELWMQIAKHLFNTESKTGSGKREIRVQNALEFIRHHSKLKVEDLLEEFPQEAKVEEMKQHLCQCLEDYEQKIEGLRKQIERHSKNADQLRIMKHKQRNKHVTIQPNQCCDICFGQVFNKEFYVFPCQHAFHRECIRAFLKNYLPKDERLKLMMQRLNNHYGIIQSERAKATYIESGGSASLAR